MKKSTIITAFAAIFMMAITPAFAQEENDFKKFNVREDFTENGFQWFHDAELLCAGDKKKNNAMTIGWGGIGTLWGRTALTVYVAEKRYTKEFLDKAEYFTVMAFDVEQSKVLNYMGTKSGRDGDKAQALVLCNPSNPCGKVFTRQELEQIADIVIRYDGYVITDEVYEHIVYAPHKHVYISTLPGMWERTISCSSLSKTYSITGWRLGYVIASERIIDRVKKVHDFLTVGAAAPLMEAATVGLCFPDSYYEELQAHYTHMKQLFCDGLSQFGLSFTDPQGAYYVLLDVSKYGVKDDLHFCEWLAEHVGVGAVPGSCFFREDVNHLIRFHFAKRDETLLAALDRLSELDSKAKYYC